MAYAAEFIGGEPFERLEPLGEVVCTDEVGEVASKLIVVVVVEALDGRLFDGAVHHPAGSHHDDALVSPYRWYKKSVRPGQSCIQPGRGGFQ